jgi:hypothetical protein
MDEVLGNIYSWLESLYGLNFAEYLWGYNCITGGYSGPNLFNWIGSVTILISLSFVLVYYYVPLKYCNHPRTNRWWNWLIILAINGVISFFVAYSWTINDFLNGNIGQCLMYTTNDNGSVVQLIFEENCLLFGIANFIIALLFFTAFTYIFKWWSPNCKYSHILSLIYKF